MGYACHHIFRGLFGLKQVFSVSLHSVGRCLSTLVMSRNSGFVSHRRHQEVHMAGSDNELSTNELMTMRAAV